MIKPRLPAGNRCLSAQSERFSSINACDLVPAVPYTTKIRSFSIYHALDASEPQLALSERGLPSSLSGPHWNNSSSWRSLWSFFTVSYVSVECELAEVQPASYRFVCLTLLCGMPSDQNTFHNGPLPKAVSLSHQAKIEFSKQSGSNCEHAVASLSRSFGKEQVLEDLQDASVVNYHKMADPDGHSSRVWKWKFDIWLIITLENDFFLWGSFMLHILNS